jgi:hypothetical protein
MAKKLVHLYDSSHPENKECLHSRERECMYMCVCVYTHTNIETNASFIHLHIISLSKQAAQNPNMKIRIGSQEMMIILKSKMKATFYSSLD